jgi:hypothetical protein
MVFAAAALAGFLGMTLGGTQYVAAFVLLFLIGAGFAYVTRGRTAATVPVSE